MSETRITRRLNNNIIEFVDGKGYGNLNHADGVKLLFERLAAYEDTNLSSAEIASLITTIESQKEEIERNEDRFKELLRSRISEDNAKIWKLEAEVKSLKVTNDLAVTGLGSIKGMLDMDHSDYQKFLIWKTSTDTLSEIERLQNGTT